MSDARFLDADDPQVREAWRDLVARSAQATPFSTLAYAEALRAVLSVPFSLAAVEDGGRLVAGALLFERRRGPYRQVIVPPATFYTSVLLDPVPSEAEVNQRRSTLDALLELLDGRYHTLAFHLHPSLTDARPFTWAGYRVSPLYTYRASTAPRDALLARFSKGPRKRFRRDRDAYRVGPTPGRLRETADLVAASYARHGDRAPVSPEHLAALAAHLQRHSSLLRHYTAAPNDGTGDLEGGQLLLRDDRCLYTWVGASERGPAMTLMIVQALLDAHDEGVPTYDHVGANTPPIAEFKRSFGAVLVPYYRAVRIRRPELHALHLLRPVT